MKTNSDPRRLMGFPLTIRSILAGFVLANALPVFAGDAGDPFRALALRAVAEDPSESGPAIAALRARGPAGLEALFKVHAGMLEQHKLRSFAPIDPAKELPWRRLCAALDAVGQQRDCEASRLYWFTDLERAKEAARASGKPILSLRLLGNLNEELTCANSRFFRTTLYANEKVSQYLRDHFVLHWKSVRPVPRVTIDFGDGRKLERTITGNSIHYILDSEGRPIDALPGLYGPGAFLQGLAQARDAARKLGLSRLVKAQRDAFLAEYHGAQLIETIRRWEADLNSEGAPAGPSTFSLPAAAAERTRLESQTDDGMWVRIARLHPDSARLDRAAIDLMRSKSPTAFAAGRLAFSKSAVENPLLRAVRNFERSIAEDTVRNEYVFHGRIHEWFLSGDAWEDTEALNSKVYAELFLTPDSDPWLGLAPGEAYTALENGGLTQ